MKLCELNEGKLNVYLLVPNVVKMHKYKMQEMEKIPKEYQVLRAVTNIKSVLQKAPFDTTLQHDKAIFDEVNRFGNRAFHILEPSRIKSTTDLLETYYKTSTSCCKGCVKIRGAKEIQYLILRNVKYSYGNPERRLEGILNVPETLYNLELFFNQKYDRLSEEEIVEIISTLYSNKLFVGQIDMNELKKAKDLGLIKGYPKIIENAKNDEKVLKLINKLKNKLK